MLTARLESWLNSQWYQCAQPSWVLRALVPVYRGLRALNRRSSAPAPFSKPVIVVGNLTIGGSGKTPLCIWLCQQAQLSGVRIGVISRGYGRTSKSALRVNGQSRARDVGDEPLLIHQKTGVPVAVARNRSHAADLIAAEVDVLLCDDGLQNAQLPRDVEILVIDGRRRFGNGLQLPAGPLREALPTDLAARYPLRVISAQGGDGEDLGVVEAGEYRAQMSLRTAINTLDQTELALTQFQTRRLAVLAGIADPDRVYRSLNALGLSFATLKVGDHGTLSESELHALYASDTHVLCTEKDAVKYAPHQKLWRLPLQYQLDTALWTAVLHRLRN